MVSRQARRAQPGQEGKQTTNNQHHNHPPRRGRMLRSKNARSIAPGRRFCGPRPVARAAPGCRPCACPLLWAWAPPCVRAAWRGGLPGVPPMVSLRPAPVCSRGAGALRSSPSGPISGAAIASATAAASMASCSSALSGWPQTQKGRPRKRLSSRLYQRHEHAA
jgi:hypothetical protein